VGKTAVAEGLAKRIVEGDVPDGLKGVRLVSLDLGLLEAGASVKGEFERRLKGVIDQIKGSPKPIVLFIDEAHMLVGAGGPAGGSDAANLLKPALARGELKTVAATTWKEYKKFFEKDAALSRRFQQVPLEEPSVDEAALILRGVKPSYEKSHQTHIKDEAVQAAAELSDRFIMGRFLPDKAFDLLDTACAVVKVGLASKPAVLEDAEKRAEALNRELQAVLSDAGDSFKEPDPERVQKLKDGIARESAEADRLGVLWKDQKEKAERAVSARSALYKALESKEKNASPKGEGASPQSAYQPSSPSSPPSDPAAPPSDPAATPSDPAATPSDPAALPSDPAPSIEDLRKKQLEAKEAYEQSLKGEPLVYIEVSADTVAQVVSDWTGIPVGKVASDKAKAASRIDLELKARVKGQDEAMDAISDVLRQAEAGLRDPQKPRGVFLLAGPSGTGKTETGLACAASLFGDEGSIVSVNMSEFQEKYTSSRLIGSAPGYVGYGEGGLLTEAVSQRPYSVVLLDEAEKAHIDVLNIFYQVFDKGVLSDSEGKRVSFKETVIFLTSNLGSEAILSQAGRDPKIPCQDLVELIRPELSRFFRPALLGRMAIVPFRALSDEALGSIADMKLQRLKDRLFKNSGMELVLQDGVRQRILSKASDQESGARNIDSVISTELTSGLSREILLRMSRSDTLPKKVCVRAEGDGGFSYDFGE
jgi:type VI secretion system protein VasG